MSATRFAAVLAGCAALVGGCACGEAAMSSATGGSIEDQFALADQQAASGEAGGVLRHSQPDRAPTAAADHGGWWVYGTDSDGKVDGEASTSAAVSWRERRGPPVGDGFVSTLGRSLLEFPAVVWDDTRATFTTPVTLVGLAGAGAAGITFRATDVDDRVRGHYSRRGPQLGSFLDGAGDAVGHPGTHFAIAGTFYLAGIWRDNTRAYEFGRKMLSGLSINSLFTMALKGMANTRRPDGGRFGWPSGHASSSFCAATIAWGEFGPWVGVPLMGLASFVAYQRIDSGRHDFSDAISGAMIGMAIGYGVTRNHQLRVAGMDVVPFYDARRDAVGVALVRRW